MEKKKLVIAPDDVETILTDWTTAKVMCDPRMTGSRNMSAVALYFEPGQGHSRHNHSDAEQIIYVISGQGEQMLEVEAGKPVTQKIGPGSLVFIPQGAHHSTYNTGWEPMRILAIFSPIGPEVFMRDLGDTGGVGTARLRVLPPGEVPSRG